MTEVVKTLALYDTSRDLIEVGAYRAGSNPAVDRAIQLVPALENFMAQRPDEVEARAAAVQRLHTILETPVRAS
jgi:flagellum-specific ATP synthase